MRTENNIVKREVRPKIWGTLSTLYTLHAKCLHEYFWGRESPYFHKIFKRIRDSICITH